MIELKSSNFSDFVSSGISLIDVKAEWCGPCRALSPMLEEVSSEYIDRVKFAKLDADDSEDIVNKLNVRNIPTLLIYKDGSVVDRKVGMVSKSDLKLMIDKHLV